MSPESGCERYDISAKFSVSRRGGCFEMLVIANQLLSQILAQKGRYSCCQFVSELFCQLVSYLFGWLVSQLVTVRQIFNSLMLFSKNLIIDICFLANKDYQGANLNSGCNKMDNVSECQNLCKVTQGCTKFSYITDTYSGVHGAGARKNCCLKSAATMDLVDEPDVTSGPRSCPPCKWSTRIIMVFCLQCSGCCVSFSDQIF